MSYGQIAAFAILIGALALFVWGRLRYDLVAVVALMAGVVAGIVPMSGAFLGFGHPAVVTVAAVLIISRGLSNSGAIDLVAARVIPKSRSDIVFIASFAAIAAVLSGFMNNVGALALLMPVAIQSAAETKRSPAMILMPLSFASILGGLFTLIGTPPNIIIASFRARALDAPFGMFDFTPVGGVIALAGVAFVALLGWRLIPGDRLTRRKDQEIFDIEDYIAEFRVPKDSKFVGDTLGDIEAAIEEEGASIVGLIRAKERISLHRRRRMAADDVLVLEARPDAMGRIAAQLKLELIAGGRPIKDLTSDHVALVEAVIAQNGPLIGKTPEELNFRRRFRINLLAASRQGRPYRDRLKNFRFRAGDVVLLHGDVEHFPGVLGRLGVMPLAKRDLGIVRPARAGIAVALFFGAILLSAFGLLSPPVAFVAAAVGLVLTGILGLEEVYDAVDWSIVILLGALIPIGGALEATGATRVLAAGIVGVASGLGPIVILALVMIVTMTLSDVINNAATAVVMAPIALSIAERLQVRPDAFLMAVAVGASCAFLTPIGHQNNTLVMGPGGYAFGDYWRVGLPLEVLILVIAVPLLPLIFPF
jgi:di/tricarboxylate transporter